jgi:hypothetical protein
MRILHRASGLTALTVFLAVATGVFVAQAFASSTDTYCNDCTIGDTPAVSTVQHFTSNHSSTFEKKSQEIYYYWQGIQECDVYSNVEVFGLNSTCTTGINETTARCHLLNDGTVLATCWADYGMITSPVRAAVTLAPTASQGNPLGGITAANASEGGAAVIDPQVTEQLRGEDAAGPAQSIGTHLLGEAHRVGSLPSGSAAYLVPTTMNRLCVVVRTAESCGDPLSHDAPITFTVIDNDGPGGSPPIAYGVAEDGVRSVSFTVAGRPEIVKVRDNFFAFRGWSSDVASSFTTPTVTFANGSMEAAQ